MKVWGRTERKSRLHGASWVCLDQPRRRGDEEGALPAERVARRRGFERNPPGVPGDAAVRGGGSAAKL